jgi:hypothetical protein
VPVEQDDVDGLVELRQRLLAAVRRPDVVLPGELGGVEVCHVRTVVDDQDCRVHEIVSTRTGSATHGDKGISRFRP